MRITFYSLVVLFLLLLGAIAANAADSSDLKPLKNLEIIYLGQLTDSSHASDGTGRARGGKLRFMGPLGAKGVSYKGYQYIVYYTGKDRALPAEKQTAKVMIARRKLGSKNWEHSELQGHIITSEDAHNRQTIAISEGDGVIHIAFDHHNEETLNYAHTAPGVADNPENVVWDNSVFKLQPDLGLDRVKEMAITYPDMKAHTDGGIFMYFRNGGSYGGDMRIAKYDATKSAWSAVYDVSTRHGTFDGRETPRGPYTAGGIQLGPDGQLHVAWVFRERPCDYVNGHGQSERFCNQGLYYAKSLDGGQSWFHANGSEVANVNTGKVISIDNIQPPVIDLPKKLGPSNVSTASTVDPKTGDMHVLIQHLTHASSKGQQVSHHYIGQPDGRWSGRPSQFSASDAKLLMQGDYLFAFIGRGEGAIFYAQSKDGFKKWKEIKWRGKGNQSLAIQGGYSTWDMTRMDEGEASLIWHQPPESGKQGDPSRILVVDVKVME